jgi:hypothetical protein
MSSKDEILPNAGSVELIQKFNSNFDSQEKMEAHDKRVRAIFKQFTDGAPIPPVNVRDLKQVWEATRRMNADMPPNPNRQVGLGAYVAYGVEAAAGPPEELFPIGWRYQLLASLVERGVLNDYGRGEELDEQVFRVAATMPCDKNDLAETMLPMLLAKSAPEHVANAKEAMLAGGYNPERPNIDSKFLDLLLRNPESAD